MNQLTERKCPNCQSDPKEVLFQLNFKQFVEANPTHNIDWFASLGFANEDKFNFVKCKNCSFVYSQMKLNEKLHYEFYHIGIDQEKSLAKIFSRKKRAKLIEYWEQLFLLSENEAIHPFSQNAPLKVLDFGAGWGDFLAVAKSPGIEVYGLEFDQRKIEFSQSKGINVGDFDYIRRNSPYHIFMCDQVLEHLDQPKDSLKELRNLLTDGAIGFISVPNFRTDILNKYIKEIEKGKQPPKEINPWGHLNYFTPEALREMLFEKGFSEIQVESKASNKNEEKSVVRLMKCELSSLLFKSNQSKNQNQPQTTSLYVKLCSDDWLN